jgi:hypothetical protein
MARDDLLWAGTNRGALTIERQLTPSTLNSYEPTILLADPKENRAAQLGEVLRNKLPTLKPQALKMRVQDALAVNSNLSAAILTVDTLDATVEALNARRPSQRMTFQICGKGPGGVTGTLIGLQGTLTPGDHETQESVSLLLPALAQMSRAASSRELTGPDSVATVVLQPLRHAVGTRTAKHMGEKDRAPRDLSGGPLSVAFGQTLFPLLAVEAASVDKYSQQSALALESAGVFAGSSVTKVGLPAFMVVVALVQARTVHFMRVALTRTGKRSVHGVTTFALPRVTQRSHNNAALFTD